MSTNSAQKLNQTFWQHSSSIFNCLSLLLFMLFSRSSNLFCMNSISCDVMQRERISSYITVYKKFNRKGTTFKFWLNNKFIKTKKKKLQWIWSKGILLSVKTHIDKQADIKEKPNQWCRDIHPSTCLLRKPP